MAYRKILLALAGKKEEEKVIHEAMRLKNTLNAELSVIHVNDPGAGKAHMMMDTLPKHTEDNVREWLNSAGFPEESKEVGITIAINENYSEEIAKATRGMDLLVIGHHHKNSFLAAIIDSTDEHVADSVLCPMLVVPMR